MLVGGPSDGEGTVEICYNETLWTICDDKWDELDAAVVCGRLGFTNGNYIIIIMLK